jgi:beta-lactamase regulating signal transducer with metallopeptidase domain
MTIAWMLYVLLVGTLLACAALAVDGILRRTSLPTRWVWVSALIGMVAFALVAPRSEPVREVLIPTASYAKRVLTVTPTTTLSAVLQNALDVVSYSGTKLIAAANTRLSESVVLWSVIAWVAMSGVMLGVLVVVNRRVARERHAWPLADVFGTPVRITPTVGPAVIGIATPEIVVPRWLFERSHEEQRLVIVHEREHVAARDQLLPIGGLIVAALLPWHPAVWWALSRLRLAIELDCDARVLNRGIEARPYGTLLIDIAGQCAGHRAGALALADRPSHLERRLLAMKPIRTRFAIVRTGTLATLAGLSILMACEARLPTSAEVDKMDVASAEKSMVQAKILPDKEVAEIVYTVDGKTVTADQAHRLSADRIATINIAKGTLMKTISDSGKIYSYVNIRTAGEGAGKGESMKVAFMKGKAEESALREHTLLMKTKSDGKGFDGIVIIDGVRASEGALAKISRDDIASIEVTKGPSAALLSNDPAAANGVITVVTKRGKQ